MKKSEKPVNYKSKKVWITLPADIRTSDSLNVSKDNLRIKCFFIGLSCSLHF